MINEISLRQFNAYCYIRDPRSSQFLREVAWFEAKGKTLLAVIVEEYIDSEYSYLILARDDRKVFQGVKLAERFFRTKKRAILECKIALEKYEFPEIEPKKKKGTKRAKPEEFLVPQVQKEKLHPYYQILLNNESYTPAKELINEIVYSHLDVDGNYIKDFQTTGFDARLWELFLHTFLLNSQFTIDTSFNVPDFLVSYFGKEFAIEAVTVNKSQNFDEPHPKNAAEIFLLSRDYMPIKYGSSLTSKLNKKYWEKDQVKGKPFILAIHDYHMPATKENFGSMIWSRTALSDYLYGLRMKSKIDKNGNICFETHTTQYSVEPINENIISHQWKDKSIPSNFFSLPDSEHVSAVLFANNATLATFNRMGRLAGLGLENVKMIRTSTLYNPDPFASEAILNEIDIDDPSYEEAWGDGVMMYHNPKAKFPVDPGCFPEISHTFLDISKGQLHGSTLPYMPFGSVTEIFLPKS
ncbi:MULTISPECIES: hypothetical protein [Sphingobacterium]|uniref:hypothetical protein n=1 Tax=Sphingobacterium TaxID=28453 RepID=UPI0025794B0F|nr:MULTISPECIES: hypothetical protein [Sphingobacterium]